MTTNDPPVRALIVDDEELARERIRTLLSADPGVDVVGECAHGQQAVDAVQELRPDLMFLDVQMPGMDGFGVLQALGSEAPPAVVFVTAFDQFALKAFEVHALDYLLKPFNNARFGAALERARGHLRRARAGHDDARIAELLRHLGAAPSYRDRLPVKDGSRHVFIPTDEIEWVEAEGNYVRLHTKAKAYLVREVIGQLAARLDPARFLRVHRSFVVNVAHIASVEPWSNAEYLVTLRSGARVQTSRSYRDAVLGLLGR